MDPEKDQLLTQSTQNGRDKYPMRSGGTLYWLLTDHLGGTAYTVSGTTETGELRYRPFGATRFTSGTTPTSYRFTGQREEAALGLYFYNARWYDPVLGHFLSPDTIVPEAGNALDYHRYAYVRFNPLKYEDESGHCATLANGEANWENDAVCWQLAYAIYGYGLGDGPLARRFAADCDHWGWSPDPPQQNHSGLSGRRRYPTDLAGAPPCLRTEFEPRRRHLALP